MPVGNDGEDRDVTSLPTNKTTTGTPHNDIGSVEAGGEGKDGSGAPIPENPAVFLSGEPLIAAYLQVEDGGVVVITMKCRIARFKLAEGDDDDPLTFHFHISALTNQEKVLKREKPLGTVTLIFYFFYLIAHSSICFHLSPQRLS